MIQNSVPPSSYKPIIVKNSPSTNGTARTNQIFAINTEEEKDLERNKRRSTGKQYQTHHHTYTEAIWIDSYTIARRGKPYHHNRTNGFCFCFCYDPDEDFCFNFVTLLYFLCLCPSRCLLYSLFQCFQVIISNIFKVFAPLLNCCEFIFRRMANCFGTCFDFFGDLLKQFGLWIIVPIKGCCSFCGNGISSCWEAVGNSNISQHVSSCCACLSNNLGLALSFIGRGLEWIMQKSVFLIMDVFNLIVEYVFGPIASCGKEICNNLACVCDIFAPCLECL